MNRQYLYRVKWPNVRVRLARLYGLVRGAAKPADAAAPHRPHTAPSAGEVSRQCNKLLAEAARSATASNAIADAMDHGLGDHLAPPAPARPAADRPGLEDRPLVIVVVDDDPLIAMGTASLLEEMNHQVIEVHSGKAALAELERSGPVDLVITDHSMPGMTGIQLAKEVQRRWPKLPVALATGYDELPNGVKSCLPRLAKPFGETEIQRLIHRLCH